ncbi:hypothetical protein N5C38_25470 [Pseudomonas chengduensis]|nr:hypothetical protein [Pseudomonas chengduensis]MDH0625929.1 hypothetical protein [Pseudomonas chengduensis]MDH1214372.1 hypothetical protein [Pseudomonas chengduensis]MDH1668415.1 hypothetical protein [Pseudomonas chengduensis]MDH1684748.1 hypothetical protein [Pseudomonas chengduensis]
MRRVYLDTEFTSLNRYTCKLISLALVVPGGPEFYVELTDAWEECDCSDFVREIVLPQLNLAAYGRETEEARIELLNFLQVVGEVEIISDAPDWDWPLLVWLAGSDGLPGGVAAGRISCDIEVSADGEEPPHHALQDARLLAALVEKTNPA